MPRILTCTNCGEKFERYWYEHKDQKNVFCSKSCAGTFNGKKRHGKYSGRTKKQYEEVLRLRREEQLGYKTIAEKTGIPWTTIRSWCKGIKIDPVIAYRNRVRFNEVIPIDQLRSKGARRLRFIVERGDRCKECGIEQWRGKKIVVEIHHIDGDSKNYSSENIILLCPNCHSITPNYRNKKRP